MVLSVDREKETDILIAQVMWKTGTRRQDWDELDDKVRSGLVEMAKAARIFICQQALDAMNDAYKPDFLRLKPRDVVPTAKLIAYSAINYFYEPDDKGKTAA